MEFHIKGRIYKVELSKDQKAHARIQNGVYYYSFPEERLDKVIETFKAEEAEEKRIAELEKQEEQRRKEEFNNDIDKTLAILNSRKLKKEVPMVDHEQHMGNIGEITRSANASKGGEFRREIQRKAQMPSRKEQGIVQFPTVKSIHAQRSHLQEVKKVSSQKRNIRNKPTTMRKGKKVKRALAVGIAVLALAGAIAGITGHGNETPKEPTTQTVTYTVPNKQVNEDRIQSIEDVIADFKKEYLEAYNEAYDTNYFSANMYVNYLAGDMVYKLEDGRPVTRGSYPYETEKALKQIGDFKAVNGYEMLLQIVSEEGKILGSYNTSTGEFVYSGNQLKDLTDANFEEPTLEKLGISEKMVKTAADVVMSEGQREESTKTYINRYKAAKEENEKQGIDVKDYDGDER